MFSPALEVVLHIAFREAISRRHAHITLEHLLYALAHDPDGERILAACGADLPALRRALDTYLDESIERQRRGAEEPEQTTAFRRVLQMAILQIQSAQRDEANAGDILAAILQQPKSHATSLLTDQGITRLDVLNYISHGITKTPLATAGGSTPADGSTAAEPGVASAPADPLLTYCVNLTARARQGLVGGEFPIVLRNTSERTRVPMIRPVNGEFSIGLHTPVKELALLSFGSNPSGTRGFTQALRTR